MVVGLGGLPGGASSLALGRLAVVGTGIVRAVRSIGLCFGLGPGIATGADIDLEGPVS